jgi:hypothetical protein
MVDAAYYLDLLRPRFAGQKLILVGFHLAGAAPLVQTLRRLGSERILVVASGVGTGPLPSSEDADWVLLAHRAPDVTTELRQIGVSMRTPPPRAVAAIDAYDPNRQAIVIPPIITLGPVPPSMAGRPVWGRRPDASLALEDKTKVDALWDRLGVRRAPSLVAPASIDALIGAHRRSDKGSGTVMAGDAREGPHGGAHLVRWVRTDHELSEAIALFSQHCDRVRVMPFLEGIPCSVHGLVFSDYSLALRPVELMTLRPARGYAFLYAGAATYWDPSDADRAYMRSVARKLCDVYRDLVGTGCFTIDGVMSESGWLPTELNPRFGAGMSVMARGLPDFPLVLLCQALQGGEQLDYRPAELEAWLLSAADEHRSGGGWTTVREHQAETRELSLVRENNGFRLARPAETRHGTLMIGPSNVGGFLRFTAEPALTAKGPSLAPAVVAAFALADRQLGTNLGPLEAAHEARR